MARFEVLLKPSVEKDLRKIPASVVLNIFAAMEQLAETPCTPPDKKLTGTERTWRHRVGHYRVIYEVDVANSVIVVHHVRHRREAYRRL